MIRFLLLSLLISPSLLYAQVNLNLGLIANYPFNGNANDISGNNINGTVNNAILTTDRSGVANSAYYFNGSDSYIQLPFSTLYDFAPQDSFSISIWVLPDQGYSWPAQAIVVKSPPNPDYTVSSWNYGTYILNYKAMSGFAYNNITNGSTVFTSTQCWYNIISTYKNGIWKLYVNGNLESSDLTQSKFIIQDGISKIAFGKKGESFGDWYKGKLDDVRIYNRVLNQQEVLTLSTQPPGCILACGQFSDFSFERDPCNPYNVTFSTTANGYSNIEWDFGDGNAANGLSTVSNMYANSGSYLVKMITHYPTCSDTVKKNITVDVQQDNLLIATNDTTICLGTTKKLIAQPGIAFCWSPSTYLDDPSTQNPTSSTPESITYHLTSSNTGTNLITNGDFSAGNTGFTSSYLYSPSSGFNPGVYNVGNNITAWHPGMSPCADHTTGSGNMMMVNGADVPNVEVWTETVTVQPNTNYAFSTWLQHITTVNPASLQFSINGVNIGQVFNANSTSCIWEQFYATWNSGNTTSAKISIVNQNQVFTGNDFALDDISFSVVTVKTDSIKITVDTANVITSADTDVCKKIPVQLNTTGGSTYSWTPVTGLSDPAIANPVATPSVTTEYIVTGITANGCSAKDTVVINISPAPVITITSDTTICTNSSLQLMATGGNTYSWTPATSLDNPNISNPVATPAANTLYYVTVTTAANCSDMDSVQVNIRPPAVFTVSNDKIACLNDTVQLSASGGDMYAWQPQASLDDATISNPTAVPAVTTTYSVTISETTCNESATLSTTITVLPLPVISASKSNDIDCSISESRLNATGGATYRWSPGSTLNDPFIPNPVATPLSTTQYTVTGTDASGCKNTDTVTVKATATNIGLYQMPTAFTPNGDGLNDCYGLKYWGFIEELDFSIYNRWGERVFHSTNPAECWDGYYKGIKQSSGVFVYMIKAKTSCAPSVFRKGTFALIR